MITAFVFGETVGVPEGGRLSESPGSISVFFERLRTGDESAVAPLWARFFPRLLALARKTLSGRAQRMSDADDAVQSAFVSFWQRAIGGGFEDPLDRDGLWNILGVITVRKTLKQRRTESAAKRGGGRVIPENALTRSDGSPMDLDELASQVSAADFDLSCEELLDSLDEEARAIALLRLLGHSNREIAEQRGCTERKVERKLNLIRMLWRSV